MIKLKDLERFHDVYIEYHNTLEDIPDIYDFISKEDKEKCINKDKMWIIKISPFIPAISYSIAGSVIDDLIIHMVNKIHEGWV